MPSDYVLGPGDTIRVQLFGKDNITYSLNVSRNGELDFPALGPIAVAGMKFSAVRDDLMDRVARQTRGNTASVTMGSLRSIRVLILGEAQQPGSYTISALSTLTNALLVSGGVKTIGSLRNIQLKREGRVVAVLDLYDLLLHGDTTGDVRLAPGDAIFIPTIGPTVGIGGSVYRPAIYELKEEKSIAEVLKLAGGPMPVAYLQGSQLERIQGGKERTVLNLDLRSSNGLEAQVQNGDVIRIYSVLDRFEEMVALKGHVHRPGQKQWRKGIHLTDLIASEKDLLPRPDVHYVVIRREVPPDRHIEALTVDLGQALADRRSTHNLGILPQDEILTFGLEEDRMDLLAPLIDQLRRQTRNNQAVPVVNIQGQVRFPGTYPLTKGMRLRDIVNAAVGILPGGDVDFAMIRREVDDRQRVEAFQVQLGLALSDPRSAQNILLSPQDAIQVFRIGENRAQALQPVTDRLQFQGRANSPAQVVMISGPVRFPGSFPFISKMRVSQLVKAASGILPETDLGFAVIRREQEGGQRIEALQVDLGSALKKENSLEDLVLQPRDTLQLFQIGENRTQSLVPLVLRLQFQALADQPALVASVAGQVHFPGVYPITTGMRVSHLITAAAGMLPDVDLSFAIIRRESERGQKMSAIQVHLGEAIANPRGPQNYLLQPNDLLHIFRIGEDRARSIQPLVARLQFQGNLNDPAPVVTVTGQVVSPGVYPLTHGMRLTDLVKVTGGTLPETDLRYTLIRREIDRGQRIELISAKLGNAISNPESLEDPFLQPRDQVHVFGLHEDRRVFIDPLIVELRKQALANAEAPVVEAAGPLLSPGKYPLTSAMRISGLIEAAGSLSDSAYTLVAELSRHSIVGGQSRETEHLAVNLIGILNGDLSADLFLKPYDELVVRSIPKWGEQETVEVLGEVNFPGVYPISRGETLSSILQRIGGLTQNAFPQGSVFTREDLKMREQKQMEDLADRMESNLASVQLSQTQSVQSSSTASTAAEGAGSEATSIGKQLVKQLRNTKAVGRLVIDLPGLLAGPKIAGFSEKAYAELDIVLKHGDKLIVPRDTQEVTVIGEVHYPTSLLYREGLDRDDYIAKAGGLTRNADKEQVYIVQAGGNVISTDTNLLWGWLPVLSSQEIRPGDTIIAPLEADKIKPLTFWSEITKIMYQIGLSAAAMKTVGAF
ncbi:polysaccharide biosynthesis/export protein [Gammaproteobacteria bacterium]